MKIYLQFRFQVLPEFRDLLIAMLDTLPFQAFAEFEDGFITSAALNELPSDYNTYLEELQAKIPFNYSTCELEDQNWNAQWEASFDEILIADFCQIRAPFHSVNHLVNYHILIEPKMAFGTGHHESTRLVIRSMQDLDLSRKVVLDHGAGTGILAILATKIGARATTAIECDEVAFQNLQENIQLNNVPSINCIRACDLTTISPASVDVVLVNITRNVILDQMKEFSRVLKSGGILITSGFLEKDKDLIGQMASRHAMSLKNEKIENEWMAMAFIRK